jgi:hypothetical protein
MELNNKVEDGEKIAEVGGFFHSAIYLLVV